MKSKVVRTQPARLKRGDERKNAAHRPEKAIEEQRQKAIECVGDEIGSIAVSRELSGGEELGEYCSEKVKQVNDAGQFGLGCSILMPRCSVIM